MIVPLTLKHAQHIAANIARDDLAEIMETHWLDTLEGFAEKCAEVGGFAALAADGEPVAMAGICPIYPHVATAWLVGTDRLPERRMEVSRAARKWVRMAMMEGGYHRIQAFADSRHVRTHPWLEAVGMRPEARLAKWGKSGVDFILYSVVR